jgi:hypothetical protein
VQNEVGDAESKTRGIVIGMLLVGDGKRRARVGKCEAFKQGATVLLRQQTTWQLGTDSVRCQAE